MDGGAWWAAVHGVAQSRTQLSDFTFTFHFHASEKEMATHSSILAWRIPGMVEPGGLPSMGSHRVGHDWSDLAAAAIARTWANNLISGPQIKKHEQCPLVIFKIWVLTILLGHNKYFYKIKWNLFNLNRKYRGLAFLLSYFSSVQFSRSVVSDSLRPHESQHARPPCPSPTPGVHPDSHPSSQWCHPAISSSVVPFSSCP